MQKPKTAAGSRPDAFWVRWSRMAVPAARRHWLFTLFLFLGLVLRILTQIAYRPALFYIDSVKYMFGAYPGNDPPGYEFFLKAFLAVGDLQLVAVLQHLLGLGMAVALYLLLLRRGAPRWLAALAAAPVLLDAYELQMEQTVMPDVLFMVFLVAGIVVLLWENKPRPWALVAAGVLLGCTGPMWQPGEILIIPAVIYALIMATGWRVRLGHAALIGVAFLVPVLLTCTRNQLVLKHFSLAPAAGSTIYGRMAWAADCATLKLPAYEKPLCVSHSEAVNIGGPDGLDHATNSPLKLIKLPPGMTEHSLATNFAKRVFEQQPLRVIGSILGDSIKLFEVDRVTPKSLGETSISRWQFQTSFPTFPPYVRINQGQLQFGDYHTYPNGVEVPQLLDGGHNDGAGTPTVIKPIATFLRDYQLGGGYTPGPLLLLTLITGLIGAVFLFARRKLLGERDWEAARACCFLVLTAVLLLLFVDVTEFSWRYQLPAIVTLPPAGALGIVVIIGFFTRRRQLRTAGSEPVPATGPAGASAEPAVPAAGAADAVPAEPAADEAGQGVPEPSADGVAVQEQQTGA